MASRGGSVARPESSLRQQQAQKNAGIHCCCCMIKNDDTAAAAAAGICRTAAGAETHNGPGQQQSVTAVAGLSRAVLQSSVAPCSQAALHLKLWERDHLCTHMRGHMIPGKARSDHVLLAARRSVWQAGSSAAQASRQQRIIAAGRLPHPPGKPHKDQAGTQAGQQHMAPQPRHILLSTQSSCGGVVPLVKEGKAVAVASAVNDDISRTQGGTLQQQQQQPQRVVCGMSTAVIPQSCRYSNTTT